MEGAITKDRLREACRRARERLTPEERTESDRAICDAIAASPEFRRAKKVFLYVPIAGEVDLIPLAKVCRKEKKLLAFPVTDPVTDALTFRVFRRGDRLTPGAYGIPEPPQDAPVCSADRRTLCILPGLCFDRDGNRLGQGKGCFDRFLAAFPGTAMGVVRHELLFDAIPHEAHDIPVPVVITEKETVRVAGKRAEQEIPAALHSVRRAGARVGRKVRDISDRTGLSALAAKGAKKTRDTAADIWRRFFRRGETPPEKPREAAPEPKTGRAAIAKPFPPILVAVTFLLVRLSRVAQDNLSRRGSEYIGVILLQVLIFLIPAVVYIRLRDDRFPERIRLKKLRPRHLWFLFCILVMMVSGSLLCSILTGGISSLTGNFTLYNTFPARSGGSAWETVYLVLAFGVLPAFCEELVYRSILCAEYDAVGTGTAIFASTLFFAMLHFSFRLFPVYLLLGFLLAGAMYATRSVLAPMLLHLIYNLFCLFGQPYLSAFYVNAGSGELFIFCLMVLLLLFSAFAAGEARKIFHRYARRDDSKLDRIPPLKETARRTLLALATPATALCLLMWIVFS
ncbi:MAG: 5-formyltetrahydrofolate cyclo-ligase [Eubacteriales bacterium]|nr:5-formyltetrahydrofolate cyclo-ligase [Eubacteriales bacterium]